MPRNRPPYRIDLRARIVALVREGRSPEELAAEYGPSPETIRRWVAQADRSAGPRDGGRGRGSERSEAKKDRSEGERSWRQW